MRRHAKASPAGSTQRQANGLGRFVRGAFATRGAFGDVDGSGAPSHTRSHVNRRGLPLAILATAFLAALALATPASAVQTHLFKETFGSAEQPFFDAATKVTVDQETGDVLVADEELNALFRYHGDGTPSNFSALGTNVIFGLDSFDSVGRQQIVVDNSGTATDGNIYVTQSNGGGPNNNGFVAIFSADGERIGRLNEAAGNPFTFPCGAAVDSAGNLYIGDSGGGIHKFDPSGDVPNNADYVTTFHSLNFPCGLAVGAGPTAGSLFAVEQDFGPSGHIQKLDLATGTVQYEVAGSASSQFIAVDPVTGHLYATFFFSERVSEYDAAGPSAILVTSFDPQLFGNAEGVAVNGATHDVYVSSARDGNHSVKVFGSLTTAAAATTNPASGIAPSSATLNGTVNPDGLALTGCSFEYITEEAYFANGGSLGNGFAGADTIPCAQGVPADSSDHAVSAGVTGLTAGTAYRFRLVTPNANGSLPGSTWEFTTPNPLTAQSGSAIAGTTATLNGTVNPYEAELTECHFEYVPLAQFQEDGFASVTPGQEVSCAETPAAIGSGASPVPVHADIAGLDPNGSTYRFRLVADSPAFGTAASSSTEFQTAATVTTGLASAVSGTGATLNGAVNPFGEPFTECHFEYGPTAAYGQAAPCVPSPAAIGSGTGSVAVHADLGGLDSGSTYHFRLVATNASSGAVHGEDASFGTAGPIVKSSFAEGISYDEATLGALINPNNAATVYRFEYGSQGPCSANPCTSFPATDELVGADSGDYEVSSLIEGLTPDTTYYFRVVATNADGVSEGPDLSFPTFAHIADRTDCPNQEIREAQGSTYLADCRAYEMVTPPDKNFGDADTVSAFSLTPFAGFSPSGNAAAFCTTALFGEPSGQQSGVCGPYVSRRTATGWNANNPFPSYCRVAPDGFTSNFGVFISTDMSHASVLKPESEGCAVPSLDAAAPLPGRNLYREDLAADPHSFQLMAPHPLVDAEPVGGTDDLSHALFLSHADQSDPGSPASKSDPLRLYDYHDGSLDLVSRNLAGNPFPASSSIASVSITAGNGLQIPNAISADGRRIFFVNPSENSVTSSRVTCANRLCDIYMREDGTTTFNVSASECTTDCGPKKLAPLPVWATPSGDVIFFQSCAKLTDESAPAGPCEEASLGSGIKLYRWDRNAAPGSRLIDVSADRNPADGTFTEPDVVPDDAFNVGIIGASDDGNTAFFAAETQLVAGGPVHSNYKIYRWTYNGGSPTLDYVGPLLAEGGNTSEREDPPNMNLRQIRVSPDGEHLLVDTKLPLDPSVDFEKPAIDSHSERDVYLWSQTDGWTCVSCQIPVVPSAGDAFNFGLLLNLPPWGGYSASLDEAIQTNLQQRSMSDDGTRVVFSTPDSLLPEDTNTCDTPAPFQFALCYDVYEWRAPGAGGCDVSGPDYFERNKGCLSLISKGTDVGDSPEPIGITADGKSVFFFDRNKLVGHDVDTNVDIYVAREDGGFPEPELKEAGCEGEGCRDQGTVAPEEVGAGSAAFEGPGNQAAKPTQKRCPKGKRKVSRQGKTRCLKRNSKKHKRAANDQRGAGR